MQPLRTYDYLTKTRLTIFDGARPLTAVQHARQFPIGPGSLEKTLAHILSSEWYYVQRMLERDVPPYEKWSIRQEEPPPFATIESAWAKQAGETRSALGMKRDWDATIEYRVEPDDEPPQIVTTSAGDLFTQLVLHEMHHRAQALNMLRQMDVTFDDLDYNAFFSRRVAE